MSAIFVAQWQMQHEILLSPHAYTLQLVGKRVAWLGLLQFAPRRFELLAVRPGLRAGRRFFSRHASGHYFDWSTSTPSTSIRPAFGNAATWYVARAGYGWLKREAMISLTLAKSPRSTSSSVSLTISSSDPPAATATACRLSSTCRVCASIPSRRFPVAGSRPSWPER